MILVFAFVLAVAWALVRGGRLAHIADLRLQRNWVVLVAFGLQSAVIYLDGPKDQPWVSARAIVLAASYLLLLSYVFENRRLPGLWLLGVGITANFVVMLTNGGYMPVTREALMGAGFLNLAASSQVGAHLLATKDIVLPIADTRAWFLSDVFVLAPPFPIHSVFSIGDVLISAGAFTLMQHGMRNPTSASRAGGA